MIIRKRIEYINRYREIAKQFSLSGLGFIIEEIGLDEVLNVPKRVLLRQSKNEHTEKSRGERIRLFLERMGPTFIKLGQIASTRPDIVPQDIVKDLEKLQSSVPPFSYDSVETLINESLGAPVEELFQEFEEEPLGSASVGQVHKAVTIEGDAVAVKIQRPNIEKTVRNDLEILHHLATLAEHRIDWARRYHVVEMIEEFSTSIMEELDYTIEARNAEKVKGQFEENENIKIPKIYRELTTKNILVMEYIEGIPVNHFEELDEKGFNRTEIADRLTNAMFQQIFVEGFYHGDPHPGNISILDGEKIAFIDFGMIGRLTKEMKGYFASLLIAMMKEDAAGIVKAITSMGVVPDDVDMTSLNKETEKVRDKYYNVALSDLNFGEAVQDIFNIANKHHIGLPQDFTILAKTLITLESIVSQLDPDFSIIDVAEPFGRLLMKEKYNPRNIANKYLSDFMEFGEDVSDVSVNLKEFSKGLKHRKLPIDMNIKGAEELFKKMDRVGNRLSFSIVLLSFSIIMVGLIVGAAIAGQTTVIWSIPAIEIGFVLAVFLFLGLLYSIFKSGRF